MSALRWVRYCGRVPVDTPRLRFHFSRRDLPERIPRLIAQLAAAHGSAHSLRAALHTALTACLIVTDPSRAAATAKAAREEAELAGDEVSLAHALLSGCLSDLTSASVPRRRTDAERALRLATAHHRDDLAELAFFLLLSAVVEQGDVVLLDRILSGEDALLTPNPELARGRHAAWFRCLRATLDGRAEHAEELAHEAYAIAQGDDDPDAEGILVGQLAIIRWMQGRVAELEPAFLHRKQIYPDEPIWSVTLAWMWIAQGRRSAARALISSIPAAEDLRRDRNWLATISILAVVAAELQDKGIAAAARRLLLNYEDHVVTIGLGVTCWGVVARPLALTAQLLGDTADAITHYRQAIEMSARIGAHAWLAEAQRELAALLLTQAEHHEEALQLATEAASTGRALQLHGVEEHAARVLLALRRRGEYSPRAITAGAGVARIRILGGFEVVSAEGTPAHWQSRKARDLMKILVARRGVAIPRESLMDLLWPDKPPEEVANRFSVACTAVRRALDPQRTTPSDTYLLAQGGMVQLRDDRLWIDAEHFLNEADTALSPTLAPEEALPRLTKALEAHRGEALIDEPYALWAERMRRDVQVAYFACAYRLAELSAAGGDQFIRAEAFRRILDIDQYDQRAHLGLIDALTRLGSPGQAAQAARTYAERMAELGIHADAPLPT